MTRSVEIPDAVVEAATIKWYEATPGVSWDDAGKFERAAMLSRTKLLLEAALPCLAPAGDAGGCTSCGWPSLYQGWSGDQEQRT